jgi:tripartite-type tricarboxylate transporter receptor subunit TctC
MMALNLWFIKAVTKNVMLEIIGKRRLMKWLQRRHAMSLLLFPMMVFAQAYPDKPVQVVVSFPPGGSIDVTARIVFDKLGAKLGQEFVMDNRGGASGSIAAAYFARRPPDGYTIMAHSASHIANAHLYKGLSYDTLNDFIGVTTLAKQVGVLVVHPSLPVQTVRQFIDLAKRRPGEINYGSGGNGSFLHVAMALFEHMARTKMVHIPYRGGGGREHRAHFR